MPARLSITEQETEQVEVDLWGDVFVRVPVTKPRKRKISEALAELPRIGTLAEEAIDALDIHAGDYSKQVGELEAGAELEMVTALGGIFDLVLAPVNGTVTAKAGALVVKKYKAGDVSWEAIDSFMNRLVTAVAEGRPT